MVTTAMKPQLEPLAPELCSAAWPYARFHLHLEGPGLDQPMQALLDQPYLIVGRGRDVGLALPDTRIRRRHAYLHFTAAGVYLVELSRDRGMDHDGHSPRGGWLAETQTVQFGPYTLRLRRDGQSPAHREDALPTDLMTPAQNGSCHATLHIRAPETNLSVRRLKRPVTLIGRGRPAHLQLVHPTVSQPHGILVSGADALWAIDLHSRRGATINGLPFLFAKITDCRTIQFGQVTIEVQLKTAPRQIINGTPQPHAVQNPKTTDPLIPLALVRSKQSSPLASPSLKRAEVTHLPAPPGHASAAPSLQQLNELEQRCNALAAQFDACRQQAEQLDQQLRKQEDAGSAAMERLHEAESSIERFAALHDRARDDRAEFATHVDELRDRLQQLETIRTQDRAAQERIENTAESIADALEALQQAFEQWRNHQHDQHDALALQMRKLHADETAVQAEQLQRACRELRHEVLRRQEQWEDRLRQDQESAAAQLTQLQEITKENRRQLCQVADRLQADVRVALEQAQQRIDQVQVSFDARCSEMQHTLDCAAAVEQLQQQVVNLEQKRFEQDHPEPAPQWEEQLRQQRAEAVNQVAQLRAVAEENRRQLLQLPERFESIARGTADVNQNLERLRAAHEARCADLQERLEGAAAATEQMHRRWDQFQCDWELRVQCISQQPGTPFEQSEDVETLCGPQLETAPQVRDSLPRTGGADTSDGNAHLPESDHAIAQLAGTALPRGNKPLEQPGNDEPVEDETLVTQWLFQRAATLSDQKRRTRCRKVVATVAVALLIALSAGVVALWKSGVAQRMLG